MDYPFIFQDPRRILSATWAEFCRGCDELDGLPISLVSASLASTYLDAAADGDLVRRTLARWRGSGSLVEAVGAVLSAGDLNPADAKRAEEFLRLYAG